ncbi:MAG: MFS transporter, partial [Coriobacteriia bacterium]|nr:MFS transporter [Coriobacteriia bacterium]
MSSGQATDPPAADPQAADGSNVGGPLAADSQTADAPSKGAYRRILGDTMFRRLWYAQFVSGVGDWLVIGFLMPLVTKLSGGSSFAVAGIMIAKIIPALVFSSAIGVLVDRFDRRKVMLVTDLVRAALSLVLVVTNSLAVIYLVVLAMEAAALFFWPARNALIPHLVDEKDITLANGLAYTTQQASMLVGLTAATGILAGLEAIVRAVLNANLPVVEQLVGFAAPALLGSRGGAILNVFTFLFSAIVIATVKISARAAGHAPFTLSLLGKDALESFRFLATRQELRGLLVTIGFAILGGGTIIPVGTTYVHDNLTGVLPLADRFEPLRQLTATPTTLVLACMALGMVSGSLLAARLEGKVRLQVLFSGSVACFGLALLGFASFNAYWVASIFSCIAGACIAVVTVIGNSYVIKITAD